MGGDWRFLARASQRAPILILIDGCCHATLMCASERAETSLDRAKPSVGWTFIEMTEQSARCRLQMPMLSAA